MVGNNKQKVKQHQRGNSQTSTVASFSVTKATASVQPHSIQEAPTMATLPANATLQQRRAQFVLGRIRALRDEWENDPKKQKEFNSYTSTITYVHKPVYFLT